MVAFLGSKPRRSAYVCHASAGYHHNPAVYVGAGASGPHAHTAGDLLSEPSLHPLLRMIFILVFQDGSHVVMSNKIRASRRCINIDMFQAKRLLCSFVTRLSG